MIHPRRLVIKIGSSTLTQAAGRLDTIGLQGLVDQMAELAGHGREVLVVTSGAIAAGTERLRLADRPRTIPETLSPSPPT